MRVNINKRQIVFLTLSLVVCAAVYLNWRFLGNVDLENQKAPVKETATQQQSVEEEEKKLGEAELVETVAKDVGEYFANCRLNKQQTRDEAMDLLKTVATSSESAQDLKEKANNDMIDLAKVTDTESTIENLVKAKGFSDCMVYITDEAVNVVVATEGLSTEQAAQIHEIVITESGMVASAVKIVEIKTAKT